MNPVDLMVISLAHAPDDSELAELVTTNLAKLGPVSQVVAARLVAGFIRSMKLPEANERTRRVVKAARAFMQAILDNSSDAVIAQFNREIWGAWDALVFVCDAECPKT